MGRQTIFPGLMLDSIEARTSGRGISTENEFGLPLDDAVTEGRVTERIASLINYLNPIGREDLLIRYNISVSGYSRAAAKMKSRVYVRAKNPFEPDVVEITRVKNIRRLPLSKGGRNLYEVTAEVEK